MSESKYCYPNSETLINKYHIRDKELLKTLETQLCSWRVAWNGCKAG